MLWGEFKKFESCDGCPLIRAEMCVSDTQFYGAVPCDPPCVFFEDGVNMDEWVKNKLKQRLEFDEREDKRIREQKEKERINKLKQERRNEAKNYVYFENKELKKMLSRLKYVESRICYLNSFSDFNSRLNLNIKQIEDINIYLKEKECLIIEIEKVRNIKKIKLLELRNKRK